MTDNETIVTNFVKEFDAPTPDPEKVAFVSRQLDDPTLNVERTADLLSKTARRFAVEERTLRHAITEYLHSAHTE